MGFEIREDRDKNRGRGGLPRERAEYFRLMNLGYSSAVACGAVGVTQLPWPGPAPRCADQPVTGVVRT